MFGLVFGLMGFGVVLVTIGGFITMIRNPRLHNDQARAYLDPVRAEIPTDAKTALDKATWKDPHARWFSGIGIVLFLSGMGLLIIREPSAKHDTDPATTGIDVKNR